MKLLRIIDVFVLVFATAALGFGYWGLFTQAGHKEFPELAYIIPDLSLKLGLLLFLVHLVLLITAFILRKRNRE